MERSASLLPPPSSRFSKPRRVVLVADATPRESTRAGRNPFASFAPPAAGGGREVSAETKVYEVPRELIEIARARAHGVDHAGKTTPLAPRPDAKQQATLRAYTARLSTKPPRVPSVLLDEAIAVDIEVEPSGALELRPEARAMPAADRSVAPPIAAERSASKPASAPEPSRLERRKSSHCSALRESAPRVREAQPASESRGWMVYAALSLLGLASCVHLLLAP